MIYKSTQLFWNICKNSEIYFCNAKVYISEYLTDYNLSTILQLVTRQ